MKKELELYLHIPFCERKCAYCDFLSGPARSEEKARYVENMLCEIRSYKGMMDEYEVSTIFIGGGTPSSLEKEAIEVIMKEVYQTFHVCNRDEFGVVLDQHANDAEITIECNPGTLTKDKLKTYLKVGINRLSMGLQSTVNEELRMLGRIHTYEEFLHNYELVRETGFQNVNIDLMSALPKQSLHTWEETLDKIIALNPEHISAYSLIVEEGTPFDKEYGEDGPGKDLLPDEMTDRAMYEMTKEKLEVAGYHRYEISNYAKQGFECRHNTGYWKRVEYLGIGLGASSYMNHMRFHNVENFTEYNDCCLEHDKLRREVTKLSRQDEMEEFMFLGLRLCEGIKKETFASYFDCDIHEIYGDVIKKLLEEKLIIEDETSIYLTPYGVDVSNAVFTEFLL